MNLEDEIKDKFTNLQKGSALLLHNYDAWVFMFQDGTYGVAIPYNGDIVNERFANVKYYSSKVSFGQGEANYLIIASTLIQLRNEFASICTNFLNLGPENVYRKQIQQNPFSWWQKWLKLLGNAVKIKQPHSIIGEMLIVSFLLKQNKRVKWKPTDYSTYDIQCEGESYEVKSTTSKYQETLSISSQFQLRDPDWLVLCRFEKMENGISINDMINKLELSGIERSFLNMELEAIGFPEGALSRKEKYKLLETRKYEVNDSFPGKELSEFLKNYSDPSVGKVSYDIDLKNTPYENIINKVQPSETLL